jgi:hypothetical protein
MVSTATIKFSRHEVEILLNTLNFILSTNLPVDEEFLKPYYALKSDLNKIRTQLLDGEQKTNGHVTADEFYGDACQECD